MTDLTALPGDLPRPLDDDAADHLHGLELPPIELAGTDGARHRLDAAATRWLVLYVYPRTGGPGVDLPEDWDLIPGARGCTPQACSFRDHHEELAGLHATVWGVSAQPVEEQREFADRMHIPFPLLNNSSLSLADPPMRLPTFDGGAMTLFRRLTLIAEHGTIVRVFYPVFPPDRNAAEVISYLRSRVSD